MIIDHLEWEKSRLPRVECLGLKTFPTDDAVTPLLFAPLKHRAVQRKGPSPNVFRPAPQKRRTDAPSSPHGSAFFLVPDI